MSSDLVIFEPETRITPEEVQKGVSAFFVTTVIAGLIGIYLFRKYDTVPVLVGATGVGSLFIGCLKRFPVRIVINTRLKLMKADYLDAFGKEKSMYVDLTKANFSKNRRSRYSGADDNELLIYQNFFTNFIRINQQSHFFDEQLDQMFALIKTLKETAPL